MKHIVRRMFWDFEKEEAWLNKMSAKGLLLSSYSWCRYVFDEGTPNEYTYRIELLEHVPTHPESVAYIKFLEQSGIECVATYGRWIYLQRKSSEGAFDIYSDLESKIKHFQRIHVLWNSIMIAEFIIGLCNVGIGIVNLSYNESMGKYSLVNLILGVLVLILGLFFWRIGKPIRKKIKRFKRELAIRE